MSRLALARTVVGVGLALAVAGAASAGGADPSTASAAAASASSDPAKGLTTAPALPATAAGEQVYAAASGCGGERWPVKTGTDSDADRVGLGSLTDTTVAQLAAIPTPSSLPSNARVAPTETTVYRIRAYVTKYKLEADRDYHIVVDDHAGHTMIVEVPDPACVGAGSPFLQGVTQARQQFDSAFHVTSSFQSADKAMTITGVGFFDYQYGQEGIAPNGIEVHPILSFTPAGTPQPRSTANACPSGHVPSAGFRDVSSADPHRANIDCAAWWQVAAGTTATTYAPAAQVRRDQMASFIARLVRRTGGSLPANPPDAFSDDNGDTHEADINALAAAGVVEGTGAGRYTPSGGVTRAQMASFLARAYDYRTAKTLPHDADYFADDYGDAHEDDINTVAEAGFAGGYPDGTYRPGLPVLRDQMASFLARVLDLLVANKYAAPPT